MENRMNATATAHMDGHTADQAHATADQASAFAELLRAYELAYLAGADYTAELLNLATATAQSVLKKCVDPQRKSATDRETVSNSGLSPALTAVKHGIVSDLGTPDKPGYLDNLRESHNRATELRYNKHGDLVSVVVDKTAEKSATALQGETLSDGIDIVNTAVVAILEQSADHSAVGVGFMETPYTLRRLSRRVIIKAEDSAKWEDVETSPIREVYRTIRREVQASRAVQADPRNGYLYIEDMTADPESTATETIYRRLHKWADLGGYTHDGHYTADAQTLMDYNAVVAQLNLTDRQARIVALRMSGYGKKAIATYLGISESSVKTILRRLQERCETLGFTPSMWAEMTAE